MFFAVIRANLRVIILKALIGLESDFVYLWVNILYFYFNEIKFS